MQSNQIYDASCAVFRNWIIHNRIDKIQVVYQIVCPPSLIRYASYDFGFFVDLSLRRIILIMQLSLQNVQKKRQQTIARKSRVLIYKIDNMTMPLCSPNKRMQNKRTNPDKFVMRMSLFQVFARFVSPFFLFGPHCFSSLCFCTIGTELFIQKENKKFQCAFFSPLLQRRILPVIFHFPWIAVNVVAETLFHSLLFCSKNMDEERKKEFYSKSLVCAWIIDMYCHRICVNSVENRSIAIVMVVIVCQQCTHLPWCICTLEMRKRER